MKPSGFVRLTRQNAKRLLTNLRTKNTIALIAIGIFVLLVGGQSDLITLIQFLLIVKKPGERKNQFG